MSSHGCRCGQRHRRFDFAKLQNGIYIPRFILQTSKTLLFALRTLLHPAIADGPFPRGIRHVLFATTRTSTALNIRRIAAPPFWLTFIPPIVGPSAEVFFELFLVDCRNSFVVFVFSIFG